MGRPNKSKETLLTKLVIIRYTEGEFKRLRKWYNKTPYSSMSAFLRALTLEPDFVQSVIEEAKSESIAEHVKAIKELKTEIAHIGNNINQIAKVVNAKKYGSRKEIDIVLEGLSKIYNLLSNLPRYDC